MAEEVVEHTNEHAAPESHSASETHASVGHQSGAHAAPTAPGVHELFSFINVAIVIIAIVVFAGAAIRQIFKSRSQKLREDLISAREELKKISQEIELSRASLANIEQERAVLIKQVEEEGKLLARRLVDEARESANRIREDSDRAANAEFAEMRARLKAELLDAVLKKVRDDFSSENSKQKLHDRLVDNFVSQSASLSKEANVENAS